MSKNVAINTKNMENYDIKSVDPDNLEGSCDLAENRVSNVMKESDNENTVKADLDQDAALDVNKGNNSVCI